VGKKQKGLKNNETMGRTGLKGGVEAKRKKHKNPLGRKWGRMGEPHSLPPQKGERKARSFASGTRGSSQETKRRTGSGKLGHKNKLTSSESKRSTRKESLAVKNEKKPSRTSRKMCKSEEERWLGGWTSRSGKAQRGKTTTAAKKCTRRKFGECEGEGGENLQGYKFSWAPASRKKVGSLYSPNSENPTKQRKGRGGRGKEEGVLGKGQTGAWQSVCFWKKENSPHGPRKNQKNGPPTLQGRTITGGKRKNG